MESARHVFTAQFFCNESGVFCIVILADAVTCHATEGWRVADSLVSRSVGEGRGVQGTYCARCGLFILLDVVDASLLLRLLRKADAQQEQAAKRKQSCFHNLPFLLN